MPMDRTELTLLFLEAAEEMRWEKAEMAAHKKYQEKNRGNQAVQGNQVDVGMVKEGEDWAVLDSGLLPGAEGLGDAPALSANLPI